MIDLSPAIPSNDPLSHAFSFLPLSEYPKLRSTCKAFENPVQQARIQRVPAHFQTLHGTLLGRISNTSPKLPADRILAIANRLLRQAKIGIKADQFINVIRSKEELAELSPEDFEALLQECDQMLDKPVETLSYFEKNRLGAAISEKRARVLCEFFDKICNSDENTIPEAKYFLKELESEHLSLRENAQKIREWMNDEESSPILERITSLALILGPLQSSTWPDRPLPPEIIKLTSIPANEIGAIFCRQSYIENFETVETILSQRSDEISESNLWSFFWNVPKFGDSEILKLVIRSERFNQTDLNFFGFAFTQICKNGCLDGAKTLINSEKFNQMNVEYFEKALNEAIKTGHLDIVKLLRGSEKFNQMNLHDLKTSLSIAAKMGRLKFLVVLLGPDRTTEIYPELLGDILDSAVYKGQLEIVEAVIASERFNDIDSKFLGKAFYNAARSDHSEIAKALIHSGRSNDIDPLHLIFSLPYLKVDIKREVSDAITHSNRLDEISLNDFETYLDGFQYILALRFLKRRLQKHLCSC
ncbi:MAG: hypothetical protein COT85_01250 [Chlamydiae bacterium CG10_big_fil_rev_8_21_14_0_10_42_34]|nr:MAG: hypothetical protein COT85_01250 [Chlamydiae bacterium CG10_big_fil_rev_8_21_14_0_10_42_34]